MLSFFICNRLCIYDKSFMNIIGLLGFVCTNSLWSIKYMFKMIIIRSLLLLSLLITISCSNGNPAENVKPLTDSEKCEQIIENHAKCLESIDKNLDQSKFVDAFEECSNKSVNTMEQTIQSESIKSKLKGDLTAFGLSGNAPLECKNEEDPDSMSCALRYSKQTTCAQ